jgi:hypothetical protein
MKQHEAILGATAGVALTLAAIYADSHVVGQLWSKIPPLVQYAACFLAGGLFIRSLPGLLRFMAGRVEYLLKRFDDLVGAGEKKAIEGKKD